MANASPTLLMMTRLWLALKPHLHPPIPLLFPRIPNQDAGIKANTHVIVTAWQIGRDPESFDEPDEYKPEMFLDSPVDYKGNDFRFIPFGAGKRVCPGIQFSMMLKEVALANLVHKFDWTMSGGASGGDLDMTESTSASMSRKYVRKAIATPYSCS